MNGRLDLTDWVVHFIHERKAESVWCNDSGDTILKPVAYDAVGCPIYAEQQYNRDGHQDWELSAFEVLLQIISDGYLHASWSEREIKNSGNFVSTIYGPRSAVCFTEMPLYALIDYQKRRSTSGYVDRYAVAVRKSEFFAAGGRPVIYGLSGALQMAEEGDPFYNPSSRNLSMACGISPLEQYRYVTMSLGGEKLIDWSHEREWRWTKDYTEYDSVPGLALWTEDLDQPCSTAFSNIVILVSKESEAIKVIDLLKSYYDLGRNEFGVLFNADVLKSVKVISYDRLCSEGVKKIEEIDFSERDAIREVVITRKVISEVEAAYEDACLAAAQRVKEIRRERGKHDFGVCGRAYLVALNSHSENLAALVKLGHARPGKGGYIVDYEIYIDVGQSMELAYYAAVRAADVLSTSLGIECCVDEEID